MTLPATLNIKNKPLHFFYTRFLLKLSSLQVSLRGELLIFGVGIDIIETERLERELLKGSEGLIEAAFTRGEIEYCRRKKNRAESYAVRFAAKEAFLKALGTGMQAGINLKEIETVNNVSGNPELKFKRKAKSFLKKNKISKIHVSLSHIKTTAIAVVIIEHFKEV